jgi:hypothetical protein
MGGINHQNKGGVFLLKKKTLHPIHIVLTGASCRHSLGGSMGDFSRQVVLHKTTTLAHMIQDMVGVLIV